MIGLIIEGMLGFAFESARCKQLKEIYVGPVSDMVRFQGWASTHRLKSQFGLSQRDARFVLLVACQRGLMFQAVNGRYYAVEGAPAAHSEIPVPVSTPSKRRSWMAPLGASLCALGLLWAGAIAYTQLSIRHGKLDAPQADAYSPPSATMTSTLAQDAQAQAISERLNALQNEALGKPAHHQAHKRAYHPGG